MKKFDFNKVLDSDFKQNLSSNQKQIDKKILEVIDDEYKNYKLNKNKSFTQFKPFNKKAITTGSLII